MTAETISPGQQGYPDAILRLFRLEAELLADVVEAQGDPDTDRAYIAARALVIDTVATNELDLKRLRSIEWFIATQRPTGH
jgi:hypothetical protein